MLKSVQIEYLLLYLLLDLKVDLLLTDFDNHTYSLIPRLFGLGITIDVLLIKSERI